jgi:hypothetical protein
VTGSASPSAGDLLETYIDGWRRADRGQILSVLAPDCVVIECYGPVYRGIPTVGAWVEAWFARGCTVDDWQITSLQEGGNGGAAEWRFAYTEGDETSVINGATVFRVEDHRMTYLREYQTTAPLYDWQGTWQ